MVSKCILVLRVGAWHIPKRVHTKLNLWTPMCPLKEGFVFGRANPFFVHIVLSRPLILPGKDWTFSNECKSKDKKDPGGYRAYYTEAGRLSAEHRERYMHPLFALE